MKNNKHSASDIRVDEFETKSKITPPKHNDILRGIDDYDLKEQANLKYKRYNQDTKERKKLSLWVICTVSTWLVFTALILSFNAFLNLEISDTVCCTLLGTTTANILGLAYIVLKGLFPTENK